MKKFSLNGSCLSNSINFERSILRSFSLLFFITLIALCNVSHAQADETISCLEDLETPSFDADLECELESESIFSSETGAATSECVFSTAFGDGDDWALWIPNQDGLGSDDFVPTTSLSFTQYADGTANLSGQVENSSNDQEILLLDFWFENAQDWTDWSDQGRYYKDDAGLAGNNFLDWTYYELVADASHAVGANALLGDVLHFSHNPADYFFGFQLGEGANNKNANYGFSGWFYYTGTLYGEEVSGNGDINADGECVQLVDEGCVHDTEFTYVYTATDACGNIYLEEYIVQVLDEIAPVFTDGPEDMEVSCEDWPLPLADCVAIDNCEGEVTYVEPTESTEAGNCPAELIVTRTWGAIDACGNTATHTQTITVVDNVAPALSNLPSEEITVECDAIPDAADVQASDNCSTFDLDYMTSTEEGDCPNSYTIIRTWSAEDACGNFSSFTQTINVEDTEAPVISLEQLISVECSETENIFASASDNCSDEDAIEIVYTDVLNSGGCMGVLERVYTATDECGNSSEATQYITITDTTAPEMECAPNAEYECSDDYPSAQEDAPEVSDNCSEVTLSLEESTEEGTCLTTITRVWTAEDYCGNTTTCTQVITLVDTTDPEFTSFPEDLTFSCEDEIPAPVNPEADDNCGEVTISLTSEEEAGECDGEYTLSRIFRAEDECGNFTIGVQTLTITDDIAPLFTFVPEDLTLECTDEVPAVNAQAEDTCSEATVSYTDSEEGDSCELVITRTFTAVDACGNESTTSQTIVILDTEAPTFQGPNSIDMPCDVELPNTTISASDLCNSVELEYTDQMVSGGCAGQIIRTFTATDLCGNEASMQQIIDLFDNSNPEFTAFPIDVTVECDEATPVSQMVDATDNCSEVVIEYLGQEIEEGDCPHNFTIIRTWSATDACDNETLRSQTITVEDTTAPEVTAPADLSHECDETPDYGMAQATDNCGEVTISISEETTGDGCETILTRTFTATDECGNSSEAEQLITIVDTTAPYFTFIPQDLTHQCDEQPAYGMAQGDDNCNEFTISVSTEESGDNCETILTRTFTITDACDNSTQATQTITIVDTEAPELDGENVLEIDCDELDAETSVIVTDNCNAATVELIYEDVFVSGGCTGQVIRTWTAIDECGNESEEFVQILDLVDNQNPEVLSQPADLTLECTENVPMSAPEFTDNCDEELSIIFSESSTGDSCEEVITRTWIASDDCGNETIVGQTITILDTEAPVITDVPQGFSHSCDESPEYGSIIAVDACNEVSISVEESTSGDACESTLTRVHTATDACGNSAEYVQIITIFDDEAPVFTFVPAAIEHSCDESPEYGMATATDNCNGANISVSQETLAQDDCTTVIERTFTATDACGNETEASQLITISDDEAPTFNNMPSDVTVTLAAAGTSSSQSNTKSAGNPERTGSVVSSIVIV